MRQSEVLLLLSDTFCFSRQIFDRVFKMATFHTIQMNDPLDKGDDSSTHGGLFSSATVAQAHLQVRLGKEFVTPIISTISFEILGQTAGGQELLSSTFISKNSIFYNLELQ